MRRLFLACWGGDASWRRISSCGARPSNSGGVSRHSDCFNVAADPAPWRIVVETCQWQCRRCSRKLCLHLSASSRLALVLIRRTTLSACAYFERRTSRVPSSLLLTGCSMRSRTRLDLVRQVIIAVVIAASFILCIAGARAETGIASITLEPGRTASGARFDPTAMTAAHRFLPFGTKVRVNIS